MNRPAFPLSVARPAAKILALLLFAVLIGTSSISSMPTAAAASCVTHNEMKRIKVGMSLTAARKALRGQAVRWDSTTPAGQDAWHWPKPCASSSALLIVSNRSKVTFVVNSAERPAKSCTTFKTMKRVKKGMWKATVTRILGSSKVDRSESLWFPRPCQQWALMEIGFKNNRVSYVRSSLYFG